MCNFVAGSFESLFTLGSMLGKGGCGAVYAAMRKSDGQQVKLLTVGYRILILVVVS